MHNYEDYLTFEQWWAKNYEYALAHTARREDGVLRNSFKEVAQAAWDASRETDDPILHSGTIMNETFYGRGFERWWDENFADEFGPSVAAMGQAFRKVAIAAYGRGYDAGAGDA